MSVRPPLPPFTHETAVQKVRLAEDAWNSRDPVRVSMAYTADRLLGAAGLYQQELHLLGEANWHVGISCDKAKRQLGYHPVIQLEEGMRRAVKWCREQGKLH